MSNCKIAQAHKKKNKYDNKFIRKHPPEDKYGDRN